MSGKSGNRVVSGKIIEYLVDLEKAAKPYPLRIEGPVDMGDRQQQIDALREIRERLEAKTLMWK